MGSYIISVSIGKGCYRHIKISQSATLYKLHQAIIEAFEFDDDHCHAFFMDNKFWSSGNPYFSEKSDPTDRLTKQCRLERLGLSKGDRFKYIFDFGDEWWFQCKVLRLTDEETAVPSVIRRVGESPEQYPEEEWDEGDWPVDADGLSIPVQPRDRGIPPPMQEEPEDELTQAMIEALYSKIPLDRPTIALIRQYMASAANLYGLVSLGELLEIYNGQNPPVDAVPFLMAASLLGCEELGFAVIEREDVPYETPEEALKAVEIAADYLLAEEPALSIQTLRRQQQGKPLKYLQKQEFLCYADGSYHPETPQRAAMVAYLRRREGSLSLRGEDFCDCIQAIIVIDASMREVLDIVESEGLIFNRKWDIGEFASLYQELNNHTHKHANRGHTPNEIFMMSDRGKRLAERIAPPDQMSLFDEQPK